MADRAGIGPVSLLLFRFGIASLILGIAAIFIRPRFPTNLLPLIGLGGLYVGQSFTYLQCLRSSNPITASLLLYLYPAFVTVGSVLFLHEKLTTTKIVALVCAFAGSILIIGPVSGITGPAIAYGFGTAIFYATYLLCGKRVMATAHPLSATLVIIATATAAYAIGGIFSGYQIPHTQTAWMGVFGLAVIATVVAIGGLLAGLNRVSPVEASSLSALEPLVTALIAVTLLGQQPRIWHLLGGTLVIIAVLVLARQASGSERTDRQDMPPPNA